MTTTARPVNYTLTMANTAKAWADTFSFLLNGQTGQTLDEQSDTIGNPGDAYTEVYPHGRMAVTRIITAVEHETDDEDMGTRRVRARVITTTRYDGTYETAVTADALAEVQWYKSAALRPSPSDAHGVVRWTQEQASEVVARMTPGGRGVRALRQAHDAALAAYAQA